MIKYIAVIRTSTEHQEIESQRKELLDFIKKDGIDAREVLVIGEAGASAIKLDERYVKNLEKVYSTINENPVECVYAWALDRIGRNEQVMFGFKQFLIDHKVNLKIVNPSLTLLNPDGTVNSGMEIAFSLYVTMAKQEMEQKKARFARARERNRKQGKFHGGGPRFILYGYTVDENGFMVPDEAESEVIRTMYAMYSSGKYSLKGVAEELIERGAQTRCKFRPERIYNYITNPIYCGRSERQNYPPIVSVELFEKCASILKANKKAMTKAWKHSYFGSKLITCPGCGCKLVSFNDHYKCAYRYRHMCGSSISFSVALMDGLLWDFAKTIELDARLNADAENMQKYEAEMEILRQKEATLESGAAAYEKKVENTKALYAEAEITKAQYDAFMKKHRAADKERMEKLLEIREEIQSLESRIEMIKKPRSYFDDLSNIDFALTSMRSEKAMSEIVHRHVKNVDIDYTNDGKRGYVMKFTSYTGLKRTVKYYPNMRTHTKLYINGIPQKKRESYMVDRSKLK